MDRYGVLQVMLGTGKIHSIAVHDLRSLVLKLIVLSVKYVSKRALWSASFGEDYVHWELVESVSNKNILGGCTEWLGLLSFCKWDDLSKHEGEIQSSHPPLLVLRKHMRDCNLDVGDATAWTLVCKIFLLMLIQGLSSMYALEVLTCEVFKKNTQAGCTMLLAKQVKHLCFNFCYCDSDEMPCRRNTCTPQPNAKPLCGMSCSTARWTWRHSNRRRP